MSFYFTPVKREKGALILRGCVVHMFVLPRIFKLTLPVMHQHALLLLQLLPSLRFLPAYT